MSVMAEVEVEADDLEAAGWVYVGEDEEGASSETVLETVRDWHDREHPNAWPWCDLEPCKDLR